MDFAQKMLDASRSIAMRAVENCASDISIGVMVGNDSVRLSDGYILSAPLIHFTPWCRDYVISIPEEGWRHASHAHGGQTGETTDTHSWLAITTAGVPVEFFPTSIGVPPKRENFDSDEEYLWSYNAWRAQVVQQADVSELDIQHRHPISDDLPRIRLWRGVKDGDSVLVLKVNTRHFVVLCPLSPTNAPEKEAQGYVAIDE